MHPTIEFRDPWWLLALLAVPLTIWLRNHRAVTVLLVPFAAAWHRPSPPKSRFAIVIGIAGFVSLTFALARPQRLESRHEIKSQGYDLMLAVDLSRSMLAEDYERDGERINRLQALQPVLDAFIAQRPNDRVGIVVFAGRAYTLAPLTFDHAWLARQLGRIKIGLIEDGTAIGDGIAVALSRLEQAGRTSNGKRRGAFVVLMTDGANTSGTFSPLDAAALAKERGVPVYTVSTGSNDLVQFPETEADGRKSYRLIRAPTDEFTLWRIAMLTGGRFYHAASTGMIERTFGAIDAAQKIEFQARQYVVRTELFHWFAIPAALLLTLAATGLARPEWLNRAADARRVIGAQAQVVARVCAPVLRQQVRNFFI